MRKSFFAITLSATLTLLTISCQSVSDSEKQKPKIIPEKQSEQIIETKPEFETVPNEKQAEAIDKKTQEEIEEVEVRDRVFFADNAYELNDDAKNILDVQSEWLKNDETIRVVIEGHCDERGTREYNIALGERRANSVKKYLVKSGISPSRIKTVSYGKERPAFFGNDSSVFAKNRRAVTVPQN